MPLIGEANSDTVIVKRPQLFDEPIVELFSPLSRQKFHDRFSSNRKLCAVPPLTVLGVDQRYTMRVAAVPTVYALDAFDGRTFPLKFYQSPCLRVP